MQSTETQQQCRHHLVNHDTANAATENMTMNTLWQLDCPTGIHKKSTQHRISCEYICNKEDGCQLTI